MTLILIALIILAALELSLWLPRCWPARKTFGNLLAFTTLPLSVVLLFKHPAVWAGLFAVISAYRFINMRRIVADRVHADYLYHTSRRTSIILIAAQVLLVMITGLLTAISGDNSYIYVVYLLSAVLLAAICAVWWYFQRQLRTSAPPLVENPVHPNDLPTVSVLIPARNETTDLEACLQSLVASTYKKLEIIVLDDCSQERRTPEIIKGFAHDGVLFIAGEAPPSHWLAKNYTYKRLAAKANGDVLLFCGVDTRFKPESITLLVQSMLAKQKSMVSVIPRNVLPREDKTYSWLVQTGRYAWECLLPRRFIGRPAVLSTCWLITSETLHNAGGFEATKQSVMPERHLARRATEQGDGYSFMRSSADMGISSRKTYEEQKATAVRTRYPLLHKRPEAVALYTLSATLLCVWPYLSLIAALAHGYTALTILCGLHVAVVSILGMQLTQLTYRKRTWYGFAALPLLTIYDLAMVNYSMWQYEFHEVLWKGRNICLPVMHVIPRLPKIN